MFPRRLLFFATAIWRKSFIFHTKSYFKGGEKFIYNRSSCIPYIFRGTRVFVYNGKKWVLRRINKWRVGFKFGELTWNRRIAVYKAKQIRKKKLKLAKKAKKN